MSNTSKSNANVNTNDDGSASSVSSECVNLLSNLPQVEPTTSQTVNTVTNTSNSVDVNTPTSSIEKTTINGMLIELQNLTSVPAYESTNHNDMKVDE